MSLPTTTTTAAPATKTTTATGCLRWEAIEIDSYTAQLENYSNENFPPSRIQLNDTCCSDDNKRTDD